MKINEKHKRVDSMKLYYGNLYSEESIEMLLRDIDSLMDSESKYRKSIKEWMNGKSEITDVTLETLETLELKKGSYDEEQEFEEWSLCAIAKTLDERHPNIPVAALLLSLYEEYPVTLSEIIPIASIPCYADERIVLSDNPVCDIASLDQEAEEWFFLMTDTESAQVHEYQMWQVLTQVASLAPIICMNHELGTCVEMWEDGCYHIIPPEFVEW